MIYENIRKAVFLSRPNRFIAHVKLDGKDTVCHVKNTGRCRELLIPGAAVYIQQAQNPERKTRWDLIAAEKGSVIAANYWGKFKTTFQMIMVILMIADIPQLRILTAVIMWIALALTVISLVVYIVQNKDILKDTNE